ncbi:bifunctional DNA primase/polymerase [Microbacterium sp. ISL-108]|nr:bifunctional DNA primase/polymerase [Microbacterium sp. ISL-108]
MNARVGTREGNRRPGPPRNGLHGQECSRAQRSAHALHGFDPRPATQIKILNSTERSSVINSIDKALALADLDIYVFPAYEADEVVDGRLKEAKTPRTRRGHHEAVTDRQQIITWFTRWPHALVGVNAGKSGLICGDIDMGEDKHGNVHDGWATLVENGLDELPDTFNYETRRGGSHYIYEPVDGRYLNGTKNHVTPQGVVLDSIDRRAGSSYFIWWGDEVPTARDEFAPAPEWLLTPATEPDYSPFGGTADEWLAKCEPGEPGSFLLEFVDNIPKEDFGHDEMIQMQAALIGLGASGKPGVPWALDQLRREWLRPPYDTEVYQADWLMGLRGAIDKYGAFEGDILADFAGPKAAPVEIDYVDAAGRVNDPAFFTAWTSLPAAVTPESLTERVRHVLTLVLADGAVSRREAVEIAWNAAARKHADCTIQSREGVEALAADTFPGERLFTMEEAQAQPELTQGAKSSRRVHLLKPTEEAALESITWWGDGKREENFMARMHEINPVMSEAYYRLTRWMLLSLIFASKAVIPAENGTMVPLNFYGIRLGPSGSGKSESLQPIQDMMAAYYLPEEDPDIGGDSTTAGLTQALIRRDGRTSFFHADEADAVFRSWSESQGAFSGMKNRIMDIFGSKVPMLNRTGAKEISGIRATAYLCVDLTGVDDRITDAIEPHDWESGFVNRFVWAKGERKRMSDEQKMFRIRRPGQTGGRGIENWYGQWAAQFRAVSETRLTSPDGKPVWIDMKDDVLLRDVEVQNRFEALAQNSAYPERLRPTFTRMTMTIRKCAALVAITKRRTVIEMEDYLIALEQAEEWVENILEMVEATDESPRARQANRLAALIASRPGRSMKRTEIHAQKGYAGNSKDTNSLIDELVQQGRAEILPIGKTEALIRLEEGSAA